MILRRVILFYVFVLYFASGSCHPTHPHLRSFAWPRREQTRLSRRPLSRSMSLFGSHPSAFFKIHNTERQVHCVIPGGAGMSARGNRKRTSAARSVAPSGYAGPPRNLQKMFLDAGQDLDEPLQLAAAVIFQLQLALLFRAVDAHLRTQRFRHLLFHGCELPVFIFPGDP